MRIADSTTNDHAFHPLKERSLLRKLRSPDGSWVHEDSSHGIFLQRDSGTIDFAPATFATAVRAEAVAAVLHKTHGTAFMVRGGTGGWSGGEAQEASKANVSII